MAEETQDQATEKEKEVSQEQSKEVKKPELPERDFFRGDKMKKFIEDVALSEKEQAKKPEEEAVEKTKPDEKKQPIEILIVDGKEVPVYTKEELKEHAQKGYHYTKKRQEDSEKEKELERREAEIRKFESNIQLFQDRFGKPLEELLRAANEGKLESIKPEEKADEEAEMKLKLKAFMDNQYVDEDQKAVVKFLLDKQEKLEAKTKETESKTIDSEKAAMVKQAKEQLKKVIEDTRKEHPFEDIKDDDGSDLTETFLGGMVVTEVNKDKIRAMADKSFQPRDLPTIFRDSVIGLNKIESIYKKRFVNSTGEKLPEQITAEQLTAKYPDQIKALVQEGVVSYLKNQEETSLPIAKSRETEAKIKSEEGKKEIKGLDDALVKAKQDDEIKEGLKDFYKTYGLTR